MDIKILDFIGPRCIIAEDGQRIFDRVLPILQDGGDVILDFSGVKGFASPFFNFGVGQLIGRLDIDVIRSKLHLQNLNDVGRIVVERVVENSTLRSVEEDYQKVVDDLLAMQQKGSA